MAVRLVCVDQRPKAFTLPWLAAWGIKAYQLLAPWSDGFRRWDKARFNHAALSFDGLGVVIELDGPYKEWYRPDYPWEIRESFLELPDKTEYMVRNWAREMVANGAKYRVLYNLVVLPVVGSMLQGILKPYNCVCFVCRCVGLHKKFERKIPAYFV